MTNTTANKDNTAAMAISFNNVRTMSGENSAFDFVRFTVYRFEYTKNYAKIKDDMAALTDEHAKVDPWTLADDSDALKAHFGTSDAGKAALEKFVAARKVCVEKQDEMDTLEKRGVNYETFTKLNVTDKIFITLAAHTLNTSIVLDADLFKDAEIDIAIENMAQEYYKKGKMSDVKGKLRTIFSKTVGAQGELFYAVKLKKSDFSDEDIRNFLAMFGGKDKRVKNADGTYSLKWVYGTNTAAAITKLFAVVLDCHKNYEVVKDEKHGGITLDEETETTAA